MPAIPQIKFALRKDGYGMLTLDHLERGKLASETNARKTAGILVPPIRTRFFQNQPGGPPNQTQPGQQSDIDRTWYQFFAQLAKRATADAGGDGLTAIKFLCPSIDEEDILLWGEGTLDASTNPATFTPTLNLQSRYGVVFKVGDWIIWDTDGYEIDKIVAMSGDTWTVQRGEFDSPIAAPRTGSGFWRLEPKTFTVNLPGGELPKLVQFPWPNKCVAAVRAWGEGANGHGPDYTLNFGSITSGVPGWRTMNGAEYTGMVYAGTLQVGGTAAFRAPVCAWESLRCVFASVRTPSQGTDIKLTVNYYAPGGAGPIPITSLTIKKLEYYSWPALDPPRGRQLPYNMSFPPNVFGTITSGATVFEPDGEIDFEITQIGETDHEGADLMVTVQT